ncbi:MAG: hypothetical protein AAF265_12520, partial [Pseudomonadota bacterium]
MMHKIAWGMGLSCLIAGHAWADNGAIAHATPIKEIRVDGKLNDWPSDPKFFPIRYNGDQETVPGDEGFDAQFTAGFDPIE